MKYAFALTFFLITNLSAYDKHPAAYWWDADNNVFVEIEGHLFQITPETHSIDCPCDWVDCAGHSIGGQAYIDSVKAAID
jgi:hypothetical protein